MEKELKRTKKIAGITLIALVITIVVLIILAGVLINISLGNNGLFNKAKTAKEMYVNSQDYEETEIAKITNSIDGYVDGNRDEIVNVKYIIGTNNSESGTEQFVIDHDNDNARIFTGQAGLKYSINSTTNFKGVNELGANSNGMGFYYANISVKKGDLIYIKRNSSSLFGYAVVY